MVSTFSCIDYLLTTLTLSHTFPKDLAGYYQDRLRYNSTDVSTEGGFPKTGSISLLERLIPLAKPDCRNVLMMLACE